MIVTLPVKFKKITCNTSNCFQIKKKNLVHNKIILQTKTCSRGIIKTNLTLYLNTHCRKHIDNQKRQLVHNAIFCQSNFKQSSHIKFSKRSLLITEEPSAFSRSRMKCIRLPETVASKLNSILQHFPFSDGHQNQMYKYLTIIRVPKGGETRE